MLRLFITASKRQRSEGSRPSQAFDRTKFVSAEVQDYFHNVLTGKSFVLERGLRPDENEDGEMRVMIMERNWFDMTEHLGPAVISIVKEFYANAREVEDYVVQVRGRPVSYTRTTINSYFNLRDILIDDYLYYGIGHCDLDVVIQKLCKPGTTWTLKQATDEKVSFPHTTLSRYGKAWYNFICANLMLTRHQSDVTKERAILLYAIVSNGKVDIGLVVNVSIAKYLWGSTMGGLLHASLITRLCRQAGVQWNLDELVQPPISAIDHATI